MYVYIKTAHELPRCTPFVFSANLNRKSTTSKHNCINSAYRFIDLFERANFNMQIETFSICVSL